jgi:sulfite exporter TauE/SafE
MSHFVSTLPMLFAMALAAGLHCAGMCGGLAILATEARKGGRLLALALYLSGKAFAYVFLGAIAGALGETIIKAAPLGIGSRALALGGGALLLVVGLELLGVTSGVTAGARWFAEVSNVLARLAGGGPAGILLLGSANGLLPCPLVYGFLGLAAATGSAIWGAATMLVLGITSAVPLVSCSLIGTRLATLRRLRIEILGGVLMLIMAVLTLYRGFAAGAHHMH